MRSATSGSFGTLDWDDVFLGVKRQVVHGERMTLSHYRMEAGGFFPLHSHDQEQIAVALGGEIVFTVEGEEIAVPSGHFIVIPAGLPHQAEARSPEGAEVLSFVSPARKGDDDYVLHDEPAGPGEESIRW